MMRLLFLPYVFLLPFFSAPYLYAVFRSWSINYSLFPLLAMLMLFVFRFVRTGKWERPSHGAPQAAKFFWRLQLYSVFIALAASLVLELSGFETRDVYRSPAFNCVKELLRATLTFVAFYLVVSHVRTERDVWRVIRIMHVSLAVLVAYGYAQIAGIFLPDSSLHSLLEAVTPFLDGGWQGEIRETAFIYIDWYKRINLLTPEASTAAQILEVYFLPLLLASMLSGVTVWRRRIMGVTVEAVLVILILPLIVATLSSAGFFGLFAMLAATLVFSARSARKFAALGALVTVLLGGMAAIIYALDLSDLVWFMITKVSDTDVGSTNTRFALLNASVDLFLHNPWGVGSNNNNVLMAQYVPMWAQSNPEIAGAIAKENLPTLNLWTEILTSTGVIGFAMTVAFFVALGRKNVKFGVLGEGAFKHYAFILFVIAVVVHGFHTASTTFLWLWSACGLYAAMGERLGGGEQVQLRVR